MPILITILISLLTTLFAIFLLLGLRELQKDRRETASALAVLAVHATAAEPVIFRLEDGTFDVVRDGVTVFFRANQRTLVRGEAASLWLVLLCLVGGVFGAAMYGFARPKTQRPSAAAGAPSA